jgi:LmbE family N-acetylglucosaminyl deacetylase
MSAPLRLLILGAHPDDAEFHAGGLATIYRRLGHVVKMVSLTNGDAGHFAMSGPELAARRREEAAAAGRVIGAEYVTWDNRDGQLQPTLDLRWQVIREIRTFQPDLVLTHRTNDYHPDHRAVGNVVRDASFLVTVPTLVSDVPILRRDPVVAYMPDLFEKPHRLQADVVLDIGDAVESAVAMLCCHVSQVFEWLPYNRGVLEQVPADAAGRRDWVRGWYLGRVRHYAERYRDRLIETYGADRGRKIEFAEVFEISEYASPLDAEARQRLFPFVPTSP